MRFAFWITVRDRRRGCKRHLIAVQLGQILPTAVKVCRCRAAPHLDRAAVDAALKSLSAIKKLLQSDP